MKGTGKWEKTSNCMVLMSEKGVVLHIQMEQEDQKQEQNVRGNHSEEVVEEVCRSRIYHREIETRNQLIQ